jgi:hypothetical protein
VRVDRDARVDAHSPERLLPRAGRPRRATLHRLPEQMRRERVAVRVTGPSRLWTRVKTAMTSLWRAIPACCAGPFPVGSLQLSARGRPVRHVRLTPRKRC